MSHPTTPGISETLQAICFLSILLVPFAAAGLALINTGLGRVRSASHMMLASMCVMSVAALMYFACGFAWQSFLGGGSHSFALAGKEWNWLGGAGLFFRGVGSSSGPADLTACLGMFSAGVAAMISLGSGAGRWRLGASCASAALLAGWTYPVFAHWVWGGGWLAQLGVNCGMGQGFMDAGGSSSIQIVGGLTALSIAWILGPRGSKYTTDDMPAAIPGHNIVLAMSGCFLSWLGWLGLNVAGSILYTHASVAALPLIVINSTLSAAAAALAAVSITRARFRKPDASLSVNGWVGGLVASSAACAFLRPAGAVVVGLAAGAFVTFAVEWIETHLGVDDPGGAVAVHVAGGICGVLAVGSVAPVSSPVLNAANSLLSNMGSGGAGQWIAQLIGVATLLGLVLPMTYGLNWTLNRIYPMRVAPEDEQRGMDLSELGADAYPEFLTRTEDFRLR